ncbi:MAG: hypothetical protein J6S84_02100 [Bacteroidales bacterium]|nr:hypothetical protein [Bacteroidales bacterium]
MIIRNIHIIKNPQEISDSLIHTAPRSVSLVHHNFRNDGKGSFHKAELTGAGTSLVSSLMRNLQLGAANLLSMKMLIIIKN